MPRSIVRVESTPVSSLQYRKHHGKVSGPPHGDVLRYVPSSLPDEHHHNSKAMPMEEALSIYGRARMVPAHAVAFDVIGALRVSLLAVQ